MYRSPPSDQRTQSDTQLNVIKQDDNVTKRCEKRRRLSGEEIYDLASFKTEMQDMLSKMFLELSQNQNSRLDMIEKRITLVDNKVSSIQKTSKDIEEALNFMSDQIEQLQGKIKNINEECKNIKGQVIDLNTRLDFFETTYRKTCIEIRRLPKNPNEKKEDQYNMINNLLKTINLEDNVKDIKDIYRLPSKKEAPDSTLIMECSNTLLRKNIIDATKKYNKNNPRFKLNAKHLGIKDNSSPIYISEYLTPKVKRLFYLSREFAKSEDYQYCWLSNDKVYLRKKEGAPHIVIKDDLCLQQLKNKLNK